MKKILLLLLCGALLLSFVACSTGSGSDGPGGGSAGNGGSSAGATAGSSVESMPEGLPDDPAYQVPVLDVGGYQISYGIYRHFYRLLAKQMMGTDTEYFVKNPEKLEELKKQTVEQCTITASYFALAAKAGITLPTEEEVEKSFAEYLSTYEDLYPMYYGVTLAEYMVNNALTLTAYKTFYMIDNYLTSPIYTYVSDDKNGMVDLSNEALAEVMKDWRAVKHILVGYNDDLTEEEALALATDLQKRILAGEDMDTLMKQYSNDYQTSGNNIYTFTYDQMVEEFEEMAFSMEIGAVSEPVKSTYGYHVIMRLPIDEASFRENEFKDAAVNKAFFAFGSALTVTELDALGALTHEELMK